MSQSRPVVLTYLHTHTDQTVGMHDGVVCSGRKRGAPDSRAPTFAEERGGGGHDSSGPSTTSSPTATAPWNAFRSQHRNELGEDLVPPAPGQCKQGSCTGACGAGPFSGVPAETNPAASYSQAWVVVHPPGVRFAVSLSSPSAWSFTVLLHGMDLRPVVWSKLSITSSWTRQALLRG